MNIFLQPFIDEDGISNDSYPLNFYWLPYSLSSLFYQNFVDDFIPQQLFPNILSSMEICANWILPSSFSWWRYLKCWSHHHPFIDGDLCKLWSYHRPFVDGGLFKCSSYHNPFVDGNLCKLRSYHNPFVDGDLCKFWS